MSLRDELKALRPVCMWGGSSGERTLVDLAEVLAVVDQYKTSDLPYWQAERKRLSGGWPIKDSASAERYWELTDLECLRVGIGTLSMTSKVPKLLSEHLGLSFGPWLAERATHQDKPGVRMTLIQGELKTTSWYPLDQFLAVIDEVGNEICS